MTKAPLRPLTPTQVRRRKDTLAPVDAVVAHVNSVLNDPKKRQGATAGAEVGGFYHFSARIRLTPTEALDLQRRFEAANWQSVQVVVWDDSTAVCLHAQTRSYNWESHYDGKPLAKVLAAAA
jgi:hypothetical protein